MAFACLCGLLPAAAVAFPELPLWPEISAATDASLLLPAPGPQLPSPGPEPESAPVLPPLAGPHTPAPRPADNCLQRDARGRFMGWVDYQHCVYSGRTLAAARWFDDFFGDWHDDEATMLVRIRTEATTAEGEGMDLKATVRVRARLPNANKRLRLIIEQENDEPNSLDPDQRLGVRETDSRLSAALRWIRLDWAGVESDFDIGVKGIDPPDIYARARGRKTWSLTRNSLLRLGQTLQYGTESEQRFVTGLDVERALGPRTVLRFGNSYDYAARTKGDGFLWAHGISISHALTRTSSLSYGLTLHGHTRPDWRGQSFGPWIVYRRSFLRPWLFYEVEPHYTWFRNQDWAGQASIILRLDMEVGSRD